MFLNIESSLIEAAAMFFQSHGPLAEATVAFSETNFTKALLFAPFLLVAWYSNKGELRQKVLVTVLSCAFALVITWCFTSLWLRPRPISPESGLELANQVFSPYFESKPNYLRWGCFPSDHAAYLVALGMGLLLLRRSVGVTCIIVAVLMNGLSRILVGLHYPSDIIFGVFIGMLSHLTLFQLIKLQDRRLTSVVVTWIERNPLLQGVLVLVVIEMSVLFYDIRFLDNLLFGGG